MDRLPFPLPLPWRSENYGRSTVFSTVDLLLFLVRGSSKPGKRSVTATTGVRQQKEELVHSGKNNPRANQLRVGSHSGSAVHSAAPPRRPRILLFLFWTVHGPFSLFLLARKRDCARRRVSEANRRQAAALGPETNGGCKEPAIFMAVISPARQGTYKPCKFNLPMVKWVIKRGDCL